MSRLVGVIPAAGRGVRAYPYTELIPKCLLEVDGVPLLRRNLEIMRDQLGVGEVRVVVGHQGDRVREYVGDGSWLGLRIQVIENTRLDLELPYSIYLGTRSTNDFCCVMLADECYIASNHRDLLASPYESALVTCALAEGESRRQVRANFAVRIEGDRIVALEEKPQLVATCTMGVGTYVLHPDAVRRLGAAFEGATTQPPADWTGWLDGLARAGERIVPFPLRGRYVNVNDRAALNLANHLVREREYETRTKSLVYGVDGLEDTVEGAILHFADAPELDEIVVVSRLHSPALESAARHPKVRLLVHGDSTAPLGLLMREGLDAARGDILVTAYSGDTFSRGDLGKLLVYLRDADLVVGTRTTRQMIEQGSNMRGVVRTAHVALAKVLELLWWKFDCRFTDVCCVYRALWRSTYTAIRESLSSTGVEIFPEMVVEVLRARRRVIEIPVNYYNRDPEVPYVRSRYQTVGTFVRILRMMLRKRLMPETARRSLAITRERQANV